MINNYGCPICGRKIATIKRTKTPDEFEKEIKNNNSSVEIIGEYIGANKKVLTRCEICGNEWMASPNSILQGHGCPNCYGNKKEFRRF